MGLFSFLRMETNLYWKTLKSNVYRHYLHSFTKLELICENDI